MHNKYIITCESHDNAPRMWKGLQLEKYFDFSLYSHHFSLLSLTSLLSVPEREVTSPSDFKVVGALDILYNPTHSPGPLVCQIRQVLTSCTILTHSPGPLVHQIRQVLTSCTIRHIPLVPWCFGLDRFWHPIQSDTFPWSLGVSD